MGFWLRPGRGDGRLMDLAWGVENEQFESSRVELGLLLFTKNLQPCDAVLLPIPYAANHWPPSHSPQASPSPDPDAHTTCSGSFLCFLKIIMASPHPCQTTRLVIGDRDPGRWVRQAVSEGLTKAHELQLWRCSRGIKLCSSVLRIPSTVLYLLDSCNSFNLNLRPSLGELVLESRLQETSSSISIAKYAVFRAASSTHPEQPST
jgi:hypothetical protein